MVVLPRPPKPHFLQSPLPWVHPRLQAEFPGNRCSLPALLVKTRPLGDVANEILRLKRIEAHQVFDAYWQKQHISRTKAYQWLARELKLSEEETHIGGFEIDTCQRVIDLCRAKMDKK